MAPIETKKNTRKIDMPVVYHATDYVTEDGEIIETKKLGEYIYSVTKKFTERQKTKQGQLHLYTTKIIKIHGKDRKLF